MKQKLAVLILILAGVAAYANTAKNGLFWDDDEFITRNAYIRSFRYLPEWFSRPMTAGAGVNSNYYRPLLQLSFAIDYKLWGLWPVEYHIENFLWHLLAGILLFVFLNNLLHQIFNFQFSIFKPPKAEKKPAINNQQLTIIAFTASLLWLVHPVHTEAVAYANSRGDSMATVFILLSLILWLPPYGWSPARVKKRIWASAAAFILALLSKEFAIVTPGLIVLIEFIKARPSAGRPGLFKLFERIVPHIIIAVVYLFLRLTVLNFQNTLNFYGIDLSKVDQNQPMAQYATSLPARLMTFLKVLPVYARILVWPNDLHMERTVEVATTVVDPTVITVLGGLILIGGLFLFVAFKGQALRRKAWPYQIPAFAFAWFFISILPVSGVIPISQILAEHFLYLPSIGFFLIVGWLLVSLLSWVEQTLLTYRHSERSEESRRDCHAPPKAELAMTQTPLPGRLNDSNHLTFMHVSYWTILLIISIPLLVKTIRQNRIWRDPITFYEYTLAHAQPTARVYNNLAMAYADKKQHEKAIKNYQAAITMGDVYPNPHYNLGNTLAELGKLDEAGKEYRRALEIDPNFHYATLKLGQIYIDQGKIDQAKKLVCPVFPNQPLCR